MGLLRGTPDLSRRDRKAVGRTSAAKPIEIVAAHGSRVRDKDGKSYIDFQLGWGVGNLGWNPPEIVERVRAFEGPTYVAPGMLYEPWADLAEQLVDITPGRLAKAFRTVGGTESVELAMQLAVAATGRHKFVSLEDAYHGNSFGARSIGGDQLDAHLQGCKHLAPPLDAKALDRLRTLLKDNDIAAFIMEPVVTNLNVLVPDSAFMSGVVELCHEHGTLVIADEVACGWGRTGALFACELFELEPDIMTLAKSMSAGVAPIGATLCTNEVAKAIEDELDFYSSYGWHPLGVEAALATVQYWRENKKDILGNVVERSAEIRHALSIMDWQREPELRIQGLAIGIGLGDEDYVSHIEKRCEEQGLLVFAEEDSLVLFPPVNVDAETVQEALAILEQAARNR
jgi:acetylornithine/succinyldiaminopimelate/putrescine aminotransferase